MFKMLQILIAISIIAFFLSYRLQMRYRIAIALGTLILPYLSLVLLLNYVGDKPSGPSYRYYPGPALIDKNDEYEKKYNNLIEEAKQLEKERYFDEAIKKYREALKANRLMVPSYYVLLDIGRAQYEAGHLDEASETLANYLNNVEMELRSSQEGVKIPPGGFMVAKQTDDSLKNLLAGQGKAKQLIKKIERNRGSHITKKAPDK